MIGPNEQIDDLGRGLSIIQKQKGFKYGTDAVLLAKFMLIKRNIAVRVCTMNFFIYL